MKPRKPTEEEKYELFEHYVNSTYLDPKAESEETLQDDRDMIDHLCIAVFDDYITDCPGYAGKVMVVVWGGSPSFTQTFIWERSVLPGEEHTPLGQIDWHDGRHEPLLMQVELEAA